MIHSITKSIGRALHTHGRRKIKRYRAPSSQPHRVQADRCEFLVVATRQITADADAAHDIDVQALRIMRGMLARTDDDAAAARGVFQVSADIAHGQAARLDAIFAERAAVRTTRFSSCGRRILSSDVFPDYAADTRAGRNQTHAIKPIVSP